MSIDNEDNEDDYTDRNGYLVKALVEMNGAADKLDITVYLMKPLQVPQGAHGRRAAQHQNHSHTWQPQRRGVPAVQIDKVWSKNASHFVSNTSGASGLRGL